MLLRTRLWTNSRQLPGVGALHPCGPHKTVSARAGDYSEGNGACENAPGYLELLQCAFQRDGGACACISCRRTGPLPALPSFALPVVIETVGLDDDALNAEAIGTVAALAVRLATAPPFLMKSSLIKLSIGALT